MELSFFFFSPLHFISARNHEFETASREAKWLQTFIFFCHTQSRQWAGLVSKPAPQPL